MFQIDIYVKNFFNFHIFFFCQIIITISSYILILPVSQLQTLQRMTSQIRSRRKFNTHWQYYHAHFVLKIDENL